MWTISTSAGRTGLVLSTLLGATCASGDDTGTAETGVLTDEHNFTYSAALEVESAPLAEQEDAEITWADLTRDLSGQEVDPASDVSEAMLLAMPNLTQDEVEEALVYDQLEMADISGYFYCTPDDTSCRFSEFGLLGSYPDPQTWFLEESGTWLVILNGETDEEGTSGTSQISMLFLQADPDSTATEARFHDDSASLDLDVDLHSLVPLTVPAGGDLPIRWDEITRDGLGNPITHYKLDVLTVARYADRSVEDLEANLYHLESLATDLWELDVSEGDEADLWDLQPAREEGAAFAGFEADGTWLLALRCASCFNPTPKFLTVLEVED